MTTPFQPGDRIAAYLRDSGGTDQELSIDQQRTEIGEWCRQHNLVLTRVFTDTAQSGKSAGRDGFQDLVAHFSAKTCQETGIIVWKYNRISRDIDDAQFYKADLRRRGYIIHALKDQVPEGLEGRFMESAIDWMNARYLADLAADVRRGQWHVASVYKTYPLGQVPTGYLRQPVTIGLHRDGSPRTGSRLVPDPDLVPAVRRAFELRAQGHTYGEIHNQVTLFSSSSGYSRMFHNPIYRGTLILQGREIPDFCDPIIDQPTWDRVQAINRRWADRRQAYHPRRARSRYLLTGLALCSHCSRPLVGRTTPGGKDGLTRYRYYDCRSNNPYTADRCRANRIPADDLDNLVIQALTQFLENNFAEIYRRAREESAKVATHEKSHTYRLEKNLQGIQSHIDNLVAAIAAAGHSAALIRELSDLENQRDRLHQDLAAHHAQQQSARARLPDLDPSQLQAIATRITADLVADHRTCQLAIRQLVTRVTAQRLPDKTITGDLTLNIPPPIAPNTEHNLSL